MEGKENKVIGRCPVCGGDLIISELTCRACGTSIRGRFKLSPLLRLNGEEELILLTFIKHLGNLSEVSKELSISYPTLRNRLESIVIKLGLKREESSDRLRILEMIERGEISVDEGIRLLKRRER